MDKAELTKFTEMRYSEFIPYFERQYVKDLRTKVTYEQRMEFLNLVKRLAYNHRYLYEWRYGKQSYGSHLANYGLAKYGSAHLTPLQIIECHLHNTRLAIGQRTQVTHHSNIALAGSQVANHSRLVH